MAYQACINKYYNNPAHVGVKLNFIPVAKTVADYKFTNFRPMVILGYAGTTGSSPNGSPGSVLIDFNASSADQSLFPYETLMQSMMSANINGANQTGGLTYANPPNGKEYLYYYYKYLNDQLQPENFYSFIAPGAMVKQYWIGEDSFEAVPEYDWQNYSSRFFGLLQHMFNSTDKRLWLPPGQWTINVAGNADAYFPAFATAMGDFTDAVLIVAELELMY